MDGNLNNTQNNNGAENSRDDIYELLFKNFSMTGHEDASNASAASSAENAGASKEIYFSDNTDSAYSDIDFSRFAPDRSERQNAARPRPAAPAPASARPPVQQQYSGYNPYTSRTAAASQARNTSANTRPVTSVNKTMQANKNKKAKKRKRRRRNTVRGLVTALLLLLFVIAVSFVIRIPIIGCMNDILAIQREDTQVRVIIPRTMKTNEVLDLLQEKGLIYSADFCKIFSNLLGYAKVREYPGGPYVEREYPAGTYDLRPNMGVEGMLREIYTSGEIRSTVSITFPEGYTIDQIFEKLEVNGVASKNSLYQVLSSDSFYEKYDYLKTITNKSQRYRALEGYMYPDTYEFYVGENPESVINRFLSNFNEKWDTKYAKAAENSEFTTDQIITIASIIQKEARDAEQMSVISSIIYKRLHSSNFLYINCDSTGNYISAHEEELKSNGTYDILMKNYNTYQIMGLPVGPICNPGEDAIVAALSPQETEYYYFLHDSEGTIHLAITEQEHQNNIRKYIKK